MKPCMMVMSEGLLFLLVIQALHPASANAPLRLVNFNYDSSYNGSYNTRCGGRVEIFIEDEWGTVCSFGWTQANAEVVCRNLGCGRALYSMMYGPFGGDFDRVWLENVYCTGSELSLDDCRHTGIGVSMCGHSYDVGIICEGFNPIRLVSGNLNNPTCSGRVEIFKGSSWGTVCDNQWGMPDAEVACRQMNCGPALEAPIGARFGEGSGQSLVENVACLGSETSLQNCNNQTSSCGHSRDAGVVCEVSIVNTMRLVDGNPYNPGCSGRVEMYHQGLWGTVCYRNWIPTNTEVVCRQMGCGRAVSSTYSFDDDSQEVGPALMGSVECTGSESSLQTCRHLGLTGCFQNYNADVDCEAPPTTTTAPPTTTTAPPTKTTAPPTTTTAPPTTTTAAPPTTTAAPMETTAGFELICGSDYLDVGLLKSQLAADHQDSSSAHLANPRCSSEERNGTLWFQMERWEGSCGTTLTTNGSYAIYSNSLFIYPISETLVQPLIIPFSCSYLLEIEATLDMAIKPFLNLEGAVEVEGAQASTSMSLFRDANYTEPYSAGPINLPLGSILHVGVSVEVMDAEAFVVVLEDCYATHTPDPDDLLKYFLIQNQCPTDHRQVSLDESGVSLQGRFSALLFLFQGDYRDVYLHCHLSLCDQRSSSCSPVCTGRPVRSVDELVPLKPATIGPITFG